MKKKVMSKIAILSTAAAAGLGATYYAQDQNKSASQNSSFSMSSISARTFDKEDTPAMNMLILLKVLNESEICIDRDHKEANTWYQELQECIDMLNSQVASNKGTKDPQVKVLMELQQTMAKDMQDMKNGLCLDAVTKLQASYKEYHDYYYRLFPKKGGKSS